VKDGQRGKEEKSKRTQQQTTKYGEHLSPAVSWPIMETITKFLACAPQMLAVGENSIS
jgi:hypothetical protein